MQARFASGPVDAEGFYEFAVLLRDEHRLAIGATEGEVGRHFSAQANLTHQRCIWSLVRRQDGDGAVQGPRHKDLAVEIGAQAIEFERIEFFHEAGRGELGPVEPIGPHLAGVGFADVERGAVD